MKDVRKWGLMNLKLGLNDEYSVLYNEEKTKRQKLEVLVEELQNKLFASIQLGEKENEKWLTEFRIANELTIQLAAAQQRIEKLENEQFKKNNPEKAGFGTNSTLRINQAIDDIEHGR